MYFTRTHKGAPVNGKFPYSGSLSGYSKYCVILCIIMLNDVGVVYSEGGMHLFVYDTIVCQMISCSVDVSEQDLQKHEACTFTD